MLSFVFKRDVFLSLFSLFLALQHNIKWCVFSFLFYRFSNDCMQDMRGQIFWCTLWNYIMWRLQGLFANYFIFKSQYIYNVNLFFLPNMEHTKENLVLGCELIVGVFQHVCLWVTVLLHFLPYYMVTYGMFGRGLPVFVSVPVYRYQDPFLKLLPGSKVSSM